METASLNFFTDQRNLIGDYWRGKITTQEKIIRDYGGNLASQGDGYQPILGSLAIGSLGAVKSVSQLLVGIPAGFANWGQQVFTAGSRGHGQALYTFFEVPAKGLWEGGRYVFEKMGEWAHGSLNRKDSLAIAEEVTITLGIAGLTLLGMKGIGKGIRKIGNSVDIIPAPALAKPVTAGIPALTVDLSKIGHGVLEAMGGLTCLASSKNKNEEALAAYDRALSGNPDNTNAHIGRARTLIHLGRLDEALAAYDQAIKLDPNSASAHLGRGETLIDLGRIKEGTAAYRRAIELDPQYASEHWSK